MRELTEKDKIKRAIMRRAVSMYAELLTELEPAQRGGPDSAYLWKGKFTGINKALREIFQTFGHSEIHAVKLIYVAQTLAVRRACGEKEK